MKWQVLTLQRFPYTFSTLKYCAFKAQTMCILWTFPWRNCWLKSYYAVQGGAPVWEEEGRGGEDQEEIPRQGSCHCWEVTKGQVIIDCLSFLATKSISSCCDYDIVEILSPTRTILCTLFVDLASENHDVLSWTCKNIANFLLPSQMSTIPVGDLLILSRIIFTWNLPSGLAIWTKRI